MATKKRTSKLTARAPRKAAAKKVSARTARAKSAKSTKRENVKLRSAAASFTVNDIEKSLAWYRDVLGFAVSERWEDKGTLLGVEMTAGDVTFMLGQDDWKKGRDRVKGEGVRVYCSTDQNVDRLAERIKANGGALTQEPLDQPWGSRDFSFEDPDGYKITVGSDRRR
jgi:lactoylglutathione lyase